MLRIYFDGFFVTSLHTGCGPIHCHCKVASMRDLFSHLGTYMAAVSGKIRSPKIGQQRQLWLSVFHSLCIQSHVRHALMFVENQLSSLGFSSSPAKIWSSEYSQSVAVFFKAVSLNAIRTRSILVDSKPYADYQHSHPFGHLEFSPEGIIQSLGHLMRQLEVPLNEADMGVGAQKVDYLAPFSSAGPFKPFCATTSEGLSSGASNQSRSILMLSNISTTSMALSHSSANSMDPSEDLEQTPGYCNCCNRPEWYTLQSELKYVSL